MTWLNGITLVIGGLAIALFLDTIRLPLIDRWNDLGTKKKAGVSIGLGIFAIATLTIGNIPRSNNAPGHLAVCAEDIGGIPAQPATVILFTQDWEYIGPKTTDARGCTEIWSNIDAGTYRMELYGSGQDGPYWGGGIATVRPGAIETGLIKRTMPYFLSFAPVAPFISEPSQFQIGVEVANKSESPWETEVTILVDRDKNNPWDVVLTQSNNVVGNSSIWVNQSFDGTDDGEYSFKYELKSLLPWSQKWVITDQTDWRFGTIFQNRR